MTAVAEVRALPGVRLIAVRRLPLEKRRERLRNLALAACDMNAEDVTVLPSAWAHDSLSGPALQASWLEYRYRLQIESDVAEGRLDYRVINDELVCQERTAAAVEIAHEDSEQALDVLAGGRR